ncbi:MAG: arylamine N-acetyltransferase, partial [Ruminococcus sp.]|nr:arylamine N-acetyltransferase [Ruminococcus sp.]
NTKELTFEDTGLLSGKAYKYYIKAYRKENGKTTYSKDSELKFVTTRPDTVTFKVTTKKKGTAKVTWKKVRGATSYIVYYKNSASDEWTKVKTLGADARSYTKTGLAGKYHGRFAVRAVREYKGKTFNGKLTKSKIYNYPYTAKYMDKKNCWTLKKAFKAAVIPHKNPNNVLPTDAKTPMEYYAKFGFKHGYGHCFVMASMFTEMARTLGYDAKQVWGYVLGSGGRRSIHSWVEVRKDGETYVCDCSFQGHYPKLNGFMFKYGTKKTWVYQLEGDVATES